MGGIDIFPWGVGGIDIFPWGEGVGGIGILSKQGMSCISIDINIIVLQIWCACVGGVARFYQVG